MQGPPCRYKPQAAVDISTSDEASHLTLYLQKQLEDDIARIFDESIYPDLELVCGKLKILTHACILKSRTNKFYQKFESFLQVNIDRNTFDEIYSFISDSYTECDIKRQEKEILNYLEDNFFKSYSLNRASEENEIFLTPKCISPFSKHNIEQKSLSSSPSIELKREYYSLVQIEGNNLDKELIEQDVLSNAFQSILKNEKEHLKKPTTLTLGDLVSNPVKHSNSCDSLSEILSNVNTRNNKGEYRIYDVPELLQKASGVLTHKLCESNISPDSLVADDPSSSSDYLSAVNASPGFVIANSDCQSNVCTTKMENAFNSSDSGVEFTGLHESLNSHKDTTSVDIISLTENTLHGSNASSLSQYTDNESSNVLTKNIERPSETLPDISSADTFENHQKLHRLQELSCKTSKEEKQKHNEEIATLESSSLSSEAGSWESVFPPKRAGRDPQKILTTNLNNVSKASEINENKEAQDFSNNISRSLVQKSPFKSTSCFIDAASLVDEEEEIIIQSDTNGFMVHDKPDTLPINPSRPVPCSTIKHAISPQEKSECNDNDDSLEQTDNKDPESIQKDLSPTIFDMTPITEDSLCSTTFETVAHEEQTKQEQPPTLLPHTPYNSIMSVNSTKHYVTADTVIIKHDNRKKSESQPIVSGGASIEDHLPQVGSYSCSPAMKRKLESTPIVSGAYVSESENEAIPKSPKPNIRSAWFVDMTPKPHSDIRPKDKTCESLKNASKYSSNENCSKSVSSIDSDGSERSSHKFYIDLSTIPDPLKTENSTANTVKKNLFSMYIDLGDSPRLKEMPARLSSSLHSKKHISNETQTSGKASKEPTEQANRIENPQDRANDTFEAIEMMCSDPNLTLNEIIPLSKGNSSSNMAKSCSNIGNEKSSNLTQIKEHVIKEDVISKESGDLFVRLSDLDKPVPKSEIFPATKTSSTRMTRSIPDNWNNQQKATCRSIEIVSSFHSENTQSLNRLFPHLKNEVSASMPGSLSNRTRSPLKVAVPCSPGDVEEPASDVSEMSSVQSSMCRSVIDSTTEDTSQTSSLISNCQSRLGQDLLRMFLQEIATDVVVEVSGRRIKAHKCILSSRCQYFAGILSGGWVESSGNVIMLPPFSYNVVHFALCHIYSGVSTIPDSISIVELATIADMLGLEGLKEVIMFTLKAKYCHHFHKPCQVCTAGVLECFPLSSVYGLDDLYRKCLRWITKYFSKVWPTKAFATLPKELLDKCYQQHIVNLNVDTLVNTVFGVGLTVAALQESRWAESVGRMCRRLVRAAAQHAAPRLLAVLRSVAAVGGAAPPAAARALDDCLAAAIDYAPPEQACRAYAYLSKVCSQPSYDSHLPEDIDPPIDRDSLLAARAACWKKLCETALIRAALRVVGTQAFNELSPELKKRLKDQGCITYNAKTLPVSTSTSQDGKYIASKNKASQNLIKEIVKTCFVPYSPKPVKVGSVDLLKNTTEDKNTKKSKGQPPKIRMTKAQEERAKFNLLKTNQSRDRIVVNQASNNKLRISNAKPKYLEPKVQLEKDTVKKPIQVKKLAPKIISSSESSRNTSPIQPRNMRSSRLKSPNDVHNLQTMSQDSLATVSRPWTAELSTDSLSESQTSNKYATYTKSKHAITVQNSSNESVKTLQSRSTSLSAKTIKTKIPVLCNSQQKLMGKDSKTVVKKNAETSAGNKVIERRLPASLMNATKSSSAKIVPKVISKNKALKTKQNKNETELHTTTDIPAMERSGTFLKDEPTFGDKTKDIGP